ncbi:MAG TPA: hypothetical protein VNL98_05980 [Gemmatimonadales bacterium]|nr:hypothetical protein [Gemmatimonadales bacterium]
MSDRSPAPFARPVQPAVQRQMPPPDVADFIRFCHRRRHVGWPDLYDEMCAVAARREFNGWGYEELAERGVTFALTEMPRLASWVRTVLARTSPPPPAEPVMTPRTAPSTA